MCVLNLFVNSNHYFFHLIFFWGLMLQILQNAVNKTYNRISDLRKEISSLEKSVVSAQNSFVKAKAELDAAESKLEIVDGEPVQTENPVRLKRLKAFADRAKEEEISIQESLEAKEALLGRAHNENEVFMELRPGFKSIVLYVIKMLV